MKINDDVRGVKITEIVSVGSGVGESLVLCTIQTEDDHVIYVPKSMVEILDNTVINYLLGEEGDNDE